MSIRFIYIVIPSRILMNKFLKIILGILSLLPLGYLILFFTNFFVAYNKYFNLERIIKVFDVIFLWIVITIFVVIGLLIFYFIHLFKNMKISDGQKAIWAIALLLGYPISMPIYWFLYIWKGQE